MNNALPLDLSPSRIKTQPVSSLLILNDQAQLLLIKTATNEWQLPCAQIAPANTAVETLVDFAEKKLSIDVLGVEPIGICSASDDDIFELTTGGKIHLQTFIFSSTYWQLNKSEGEQPAAEEYEFYSMNSLPWVCAYSQRILNVFKAWLDTRAFQFQ